MRYLVFLVGPSLVGVALGTLFGKGWRVYVLYGAGLVAGFFAVVGIYLSSPTNYDPFGCSECREHLGRWWEPDSVLIFVGLAYFFYLNGIWVGLGVREVFQAVKTRRSGSAT